MPTRIPPDLRQLYEVHDWRHAEIILANEFPAEFADICDALRAFRFTTDQVIQAGGNESPIPKTFSGLLRPNGWNEAQLAAQLVVDGEPIINYGTHKIDYCKGRIAVDLEWNSKDQTFDRDLYAFRAFWEYNKISVGVLVTRSNELDQFFTALGTYTDKYGVQRRYKDKFGASTTHIGKLRWRLEAGRSGGCPVLVFGITPRLLIEANNGEANDQRG